MSLETPECEAHGGSSHARGKRPPAVEVSSFSSYPKNTDLRTNIYFAPERLLGYSTDTSCTSRGQEPPTESVVFFRSDHLCSSLKCYVASLYQLRGLNATKLTKNSFSFYCYTRLFAVWNKYQATAAIAIAEAIGPKKVSVGNVNPAVTPSAIITPISASPAI